MKHTKKPIVNPFPVINPLDEKLTPTKRKISWKIKAPILLVLAIAVIVGINAFFNTYYLVSPIKFQNPLRVRGYEYPITIKESELETIIKEEIDRGKTEIKKETSIIVKPVQAQEPESKPISWYIDKVWMKETTRGTNRVEGGLQDMCADKGMWNEYGYGGMSNPICFADKAEADITLTKWFEKHLATKTDAQTFCYYAHGKLMDDCAYYQGVLTIE